MVGSTPLLCPNLAERVFSDLGGPGLDCWTSLGGTQASRSHENCTIAQCCANNVQINGVGTTHVEPSCQCASIGPQILDVMKIINSNLIPIVAVEGEEANYRIVVTAHRPGLDFTLISHTAGGSLGNAKENKLPICQITAVRQIASSISPEQPWFWIDTLCLPLAYLRRPEIRLVLTKSIKTISQSAKQTVVVDADHSLLTSSSDASEIFMRIAYSSWSSRLWTLQEAVYARRLMFRLFDRNVEWDSLSQNGGSGITGAWATAWAIRFPYGTLMRHLSSARKDHLTKSDEYLCFLRRTLNGRTTSDESDEPLIIANLLGIDQDDTEQHLELSRCMRILGKPSI